MGEIKTNNNPELQKNNMDNWKDIMPGKDNPFDLPEVNPFPGIEPKPWHIIPEIPIDDVSPRVNPMPKFDNPKDIKDYFKQELDKKYDENGKVLSEEKKINENNEVISEGETTDINENIDNYVDDLKEKSEYPETIPDKPFDENDIKVRTPEETKEARKEFDNNKDKLISDWEKETGKEWPRYKEDVVDKNGNVLRKAGDRYDAHHIQPLKLGGENKASNITPLDIKSHNVIHSKEGSCTKVVKAVEGGKN